VHSENKNGLPLNTSLQKQYEEAQPDPSLNCFPDTVHHVHLMGICGTGMAALAGMLQDNGYHVTGSDAQVYPPMSNFLAGMGITVCSGYGPQNLQPHPDLVVVGNVITRKNPEAKALADLRIPYVSFPQTLSHYYLAGKTSLVVAGTHGKTTTSSILATLLDDAGMAPGFMIGGIVQAFGRNYNVGKGQYFVVEGDEYDTAFFDKGPKFLHYQPHVAILTSIEFDHADIYADLEAVIRSFEKLVAIMPQDGLLVACLDDPVVREVVMRAPCRVIGYGLGAHLNWSVSDLQVTPEGTHFKVLRDGKEFDNFTSVMPGRHNALNSLAVIAVLDHLGLDRKIIRQGLQNFQGVKRRQEVRGVVRGITVIDDFAHHPTAVSETLAALKGAYGGRRLIAVFDPRTNTSRRKVFQQAYVSVFDKADCILVKKPEPLQNIPFENQFSSEELARDLRQRNLDAHYFPTTDAILTYLEGFARDGDVVAFLSNGGFDDIHARFLERLRSL
jgi:UDP-N-acetylmuramate: L-alanyl-gamma-D-glutamyl-meso-diaminopimelate ligase